MIAEYPLFTLALIYLVLYYFSLKKVIKNKIFTKKKIYILICIVLFIPIVGVFVPLFMFLEEDKSTKNDYITSTSDKVEVFENSISSSEDSINID